MNQVNYRYGFRNNYRATMPLSEMLFKDLIDFIKCISYRFYHKGQLPVVVVYPDFPSKKTTIYKICKHLKFRLTNKPVQASLVIYFEDNTLGNTQAIERYYGNRKIINGQCRDISKQKVEVIHTQTFGYNTCIDPLTYQGLALVKSDENAKHDGQQIMCPLPSQETGKVYQIIIDNTISKEEVVDMRVPVYGDQIPLVYQKFKTMEQRYTNQVLRTTLHSTEEMLSPKEQELIVAFVKGMGADWCELDVLRHKADGRIYIVDLNKTAYGPPAELADKLKAVDVLCKCFSQKFMHNTVSN